MFFPFLLPFVVLAQDATPSSTPALTPTPTPTPSAVVSFISTPSQVNKNTAFNISFQLNNGKPGTYYRFKVYGGSSGDTNSIEVNYTDSSWANGGDSSTWGVMPQYQTDSSGNRIVNLSLRTTSDKSSGTYQIYAKAKESDTSTETAASSSRDLVVVDVIATSTPVPSLTPTPTPTATPTKIEPTPTLMPPTPTDIPTEIPQPTSLPTSPPSNSNIELSNVTPSQPQKTFNFLPLIFVGGGIALLAPLIITSLPRFKKQK